MQLGVEARCRAVKIVGASDHTLARRLTTPNKALRPPGQSTSRLKYAEVFEQTAVVLGSRELVEQRMVKPARGRRGGPPIDFI